MNQEEVMDEYEPGLIDWFEMYVLTGSSQDWRL